MHPAALEAGRQLAESLMTDTCVIRRKSGRATDPTTGVVGDVWTPVWGGPCKLQERETQARNAQAGERVVVVARPELHVPVDSPLVQVDDVAEVTGSLDPENVGRRVRIASLPVGSQKTARRYPVEEAQS